MSDALMEDAPAGASVGGRLSVDPCARCGHRHKRADTSQGIVEWITSCPECRCRASQDEYEGNAAVVPIRAGADELGAQHRDYDHRCGDACVTSACGRDDDDWEWRGLFPGQRDADRARAMDASRDMRGRWLDRLIGFCLSQFSWNKCPQLVFGWGDLGRFRGRADHGGGTDTARPAGPVGRV